MRTPHISLERTQPQSLSARTRQWFHAWAERHIVAYDPFDAADLQRSFSEKRVPFWMEVGLTVLLVSAFVLYVIGAVVLWRWLAG